MKKFEGWPTTRMFPRRMQDAFKDDIANAQWFYPPEKNETLSNIIMGIAATILWVAIAYLLAKN